MTESKPIRWEKANRIVSFTAIITTRNVWDGTFKGKLSSAVNLKRQPELFKFDSRRHQCKAKPPTWRAFGGERDKSRQIRADSVNEKWPEKLACCHKRIHLNACTDHASFLLRRLLKEHWQKSRLTAKRITNCTLADHSFETDHEIEWNNASTITYNSRYLQGICLEAWHINNADDSRDDRNLFLED